GAVALNDYARANDPFTKVGKIQVAIEISSVIRASNDSFRIAWLERRYENASLAVTERWTAIAEKFCVTITKAPGPPITLSR
ncbi:MAG: VirB8/TrbF family protein, partial [Rhodoplanes sp.]